jgi:myo-inositol-1(or 4)-monophosphatase
MHSPHSADSGLAARCDLVRRLAIDVGREAEAFRQGADAETLGVATKGLQDFVTVADRRAEDRIRAELARAFPDDGFVGEETGGTGSSGGYWVVDPIDGTTNYLRGLRHWGVSIAFVRDGAVQVGCVYDAARDSVYSAIAGQGALRDGLSIRASAVSDPRQALAIVGYSRRTSFAEHQLLLGRLHEEGIEYRRLGSAALGLVRVAAGTADLYWEAHLNGWDMLAGALIAAEAGAEVLMLPVERAVAEGSPVAAYAPGLAASFAFLRENFEG